MASSRSNCVNTWARTATSPNHEGVVGTDSGAIWTLTEGCFILVLCPPYWAIDVFHPFKETHVCLFYQDFILSVSHALSADRLLLSRCAYRGLSGVGTGRLLQGSVASRFK